MTIEEAPSPSSDRVCQLVMDLATANGYDGPPPDQDAALSAIGFDSLLTIELVARLEDEFGVEVPEERLTPGSFATVASVVSLLDTIR